MSFKEDWVHHRQLGFSLWERVAICVLAEVAELFVVNLKKIAGSVCALTIGALLYKAYKTQVVAWVASYELDSLLEWFQLIGDVLLITMAFLAAAAGALVCVILICGVIVWWDTQLDREVRRFRR